MTRIPSTRFSTSVLWLLVLGACLGLFASMAGDRKASAVASEDSTEMSAETMHRGWTGGRGAWITDSHRSHAPAAAPAAASFLKYAGSTLWSAFLDVVVKDSFAYCVMSAGLLILDVSDSTHPVRVSELYLQGQPKRDIEVANGRAYVGAGHDGFHIVDVHDPHHPVLLGSHDLHADWAAAMDLEVAGSYLYVSTFDLLLIYDVSLPHAPVRVAASGPVIGHAHSAIAIGDYVYVAGGPEGLHVVNVVDPSAPVLIQTLPEAGRAELVEREDSLLFVFDGDDIALTIWDIGNPDSISQVGTRDVSLWCDDMEVKNGMLFAVDAEDRLAIADISNPPPFIWEDIAWDSLSAALGLWVSEDLVYVADVRLGLRILSHSGASAMPSEIGAVETARTLDAVTVAGDVALVREYDAYHLADWALNLVDISNPAMPVPLAIYPGTGRIYDVAAAGSYAYVADNVTGLQVVDISNPLQPQMVTAVSPLYAYDVTVLDGFLYAANTAGLEVYDLADPASPSWASSITQVGGIRSIVASGELLYARTDSGQFQIIDVQNPHAPTLKGRYPSGTMTVEAVSENFAYLMNSTYLEIVDITDPTIPDPRGRYYSTLRCRGAAVSGSYAYLAEWHLSSITPSAVRVLDVSNPDLPVEVDSYATPGQAWAVAVAKGHVLVADDREFLSLAQTFGRGDVNANGTVAVSDVVFLVNYLYKSGPAPLPIKDAGDVNCSGEVDLIDLLYLAHHLLRSGPPPC